MPDEREAQEGREEGAYEPGRAIARQLDVRIGRLVREHVLPERALLGLPIGVALFDSGQHREVEGGRRRGRRPLQRAPVPGIAGCVAQLLAMAEADHELRDLQPDSCEDDGDAGGRHEQPGMPLGNIVMLHAPRHAHKAQHVEGHEGQIETEQPAPERGLPQALLEAEAESLREPEGVTGERAEQDAADDDVMEVRHEKQAVVKHEVGRRDRQQHAGHSADDEGDEKAERPQHRRRIADAAAVHSEQPVEDFHARRHRDNHRRDGEERVHVGAGPHGEEMMQPDHEGEDADGHRRGHHGAVAEQRLAREG
jgi:hypothetical protein